MDREDEHQVSTANDILPLYGSLLTPSSRVDPLDQTLLTYMSTGEVIPCDLVVLRDAKGEIITIT